jgi:hypothetical protein
MPSTSFHNVKNLLGELSCWMSGFAEDNNFAPTRRGRLLLTMLLLASIAQLLEEDKPSPELRKKLLSYFGACLAKKEGTEEYFHDLLGIRFGGTADFSVMMDSSVN